MSEDFNDWQQHQRVQQDRWDYATNSGQYAPPAAPSTHDWSSPGSHTSSGGGGYSGGYAGGYSSSYSSGPTFLSIVPWIPALPVLYPLPFAVAFAASGIGYGIMEVQFVVYTASGRNWLAAGALLIGAILFFATMRLEQRLAASVLWRAPRHVLRLVVVMAVAHLIAASQLRAPGQSVEDAMLDMTSLRNPVYLLSLAVPAILAHIVLTRPKLKDWWHTRLEKAWLKRSA